MKNMKTKIKTHAIAILLLLFVSNACTDDFLSINTPNNLITADHVNVNLLLTRVQAYSVILDEPAIRSDVANYCGMSANVAGRPFNEGENVEPWNNVYQNYARNLSKIIEICQNDDNTAGLVNKIAIARIMKAWVFARLTDIYGDIPYSESCLPQEEAVYNPKYDTQQSIYKDLFKELKEAAAQLDASKESYGAADLIYKGDVTKWKKLANSLRLRLALRVRYADNQMARDQMGDLNESNLIVTRADDAYIFTATDYPENQNRQYNILLQFTSTSKKDLVGKTMLDILIGSGDAHHPVDPRIKIYADTATANWPGTPGHEDVSFFGYRGHPLLGLVPIQEKYPYTAESVSRMPDLAYVPEIEMPVFRCSETYFALAEAAQAGLKGSAAEAQAYYKKGIEAALDWAKVYYETCVPQLPKVVNLLHPTWNEEDINQYLTHKQITQEEIDVFLASPDATLTGTDEEKLEQIINQKIVAIYPNQFEGWAEYRRTGYPRILIGHDEDPLKGVIPRRFMYPTVERNINSHSYEEAVQRMGGTDKMLNKVWWDKNPLAPHEHPGEVEWRELPWINK
jgi:hypothetical protein